MALVHAQFTLSNVTATQICGADNMSHDVLVRNYEHGSSHYVYVGNSNVSAANGFDVAPGETVRFTLAPNDQLFAIGGGNGYECAMFDMRQND